MKYETVLSGDYIFAHVWLLSSCGLLFKQMVHVPYVFCIFKNVMRLFFIQHLKNVENSLKNLVVVVFLRYVTSFETGNQPVTDIFHFVVYDGENNRLENQMFTITITSTQRQPPVVTVRSGIKVRTVPTSPVK